MRKLSLLVAFVILGLVGSTVHAGEKYKIGLCMASLDTFLSSMAQAAIDHAEKTGIVELTLVDADPCRRPGRHRPPDRPGNHPGGKRR
ncbi:MAG: hypothetical protein LIQ30_08615 [Planctomycetes bacterium]|nr:hypothetical protein [Planctomycetota bacterium]